ncbi:MAG: glycosyltransferase family 1 protein [Calditrichaeota bacterium]|nr:glycosyltransferase family 1 protein [Calditrichota bacterium]
MRPIHSFTVVPSLPENLGVLRELAFNLRWSWDHETIELFRRLDRNLWEETGHNPVLLLSRIRQEQLEEAASDAGFMAHYERVGRNLSDYLNDKSTWYRKTYGTDDQVRIAYFSAEFGLTECLPIYSGGLGILAGDHLKSASELGLPLVGVGLLYQQGYFRQYLNADGWQQESYPFNDFYNMPIELEQREDGSPLTVDVAYPGRTVTAQIWRVQVGRVPLYLLDTNIEANRREDQDITDQLYGGDTEMRVQQEMMLGIGGMAALAALNLQPTVCHMNEGHSAFLALERIRRLMETHGLSFAEAREVASAGHVFTTHTPVAAGNDYFAPALMDKYFSDTYRALGLSRKEFLALGRQHAEDDKEPFCMTILALRLSAHCNGVSQLHKVVARRMWQGIWPGVPEDELPIAAVTNGIHYRSWISKEMASLYDRYLGPVWLERPADQSVWAGIEEMPVEELWRTHERRRERLVAFARRRLRLQAERRGLSSSDRAVADEVLNPDALTIGFGRRFATYKRATLLLRNPERLIKILDDPDRPVQIIFAGKAHPQDNLGKDLIRQIIHFARTEEARRHIVFIEDYDMDVARYLVQGVDVWLNTPRRLQEASGTSGMKATANGAINLSVLDGWWDEAYSPEVGWPIGLGEEYEDFEYQDEVESNAIYDLLEKEIVPMFYERGRDGLPRRWVARMKSAMRAVCPVFNTNRMVHEYAERFYMPSAEHFEHLAADQFARAKALALWKARVRSNWPQVHVETVEAPAVNQFKVGDKVDAKARIHLGNLKPEDVAVELYLGRLNTKGNITDAGTTRMEPVESQSDENYLYAASAVPCHKSGLHGYTIRVMPWHEDLWGPWETGLVAWA